MCVRAAASLHSSYLPGTPDVGYIENPYAAEPIFLRARAEPAFSLRRRAAEVRGGNPLCAAIEAAICHLDRHKHQVLVNRHISLPTGTTSSMLTNLGLSWI
jgi:hypothetical protein